MQLHSDMTEWICPDAHVFIIWRGRQAAHKRNNMLLVQGRPRPVYCNMTSLRAGPYKANNGKMPLTYGQGPGQDKEDKHKPHLPLWYEKVCSALSAKQDRPYCYRDLSARLRAR
jgi:hypothetical protein